MTDEQRKDKGFLKRFLRSPAVHEQIAGFKRKLEDVRSNLIVRRLSSFARSSSMFTVHQLANTIATRMEMKQSLDLNDSSPRSPDPRHLADGTDPDLAEYAKDVNDTIFLFNNIALY